MFNSSSGDIDRDAASRDADAGRRRLFEERYGSGAMQVLTNLFANPCVTYADIGKRFGVTRERVRQWHVSLSPDSPRGHERRRLCQAQQQRRRLLADPVYRAFVRVARAHFPQAGVQPIASRTGLLKRVVRFGTWTIALKRAGAARARYGEARTMSYSLTGSRAKVDFFFFQLPDDAYLLLPANLLPRRGTTFLDAVGSRYFTYKNVFHVPVSGGDARDSAMTPMPVEREDAPRDDARRSDDEDVVGGAWCHCSKA